MEINNFSVQTSKTKLWITSDFSIKEIMLIDLKGNVIQVSQQPNLPIDKLAFGTYVVVVNFKNYDALGIEKITIINLTTNQSQKSSD